jgi:hypothetical protein
VSVRNPLNRAASIGIVQQWTFDASFLPSRRTIISRADEFCTNADGCREQAARAVNPLDKERWLKIAEHLLQMAQEADDSKTGNGR